MKTGTHASAISRRAVLAGALSPRLLYGAAPPNIVFILADDLGYADLSCYGRRDYRTPNIDRLASGGVRFTQAYANSAVCSASRTALITGRYQYRIPIGLEEPLATRDVRDLGLPPSHPTLPSLLRKAGYGTTLIGKWHLGKLPKYGPLQSGYDHFWGFRGPSLDYFTHKDAAGTNGAHDLWEDDAPVHQNGYLTDLFGDRAVSVVRRYAAQKQPFLLSLHFNAPHWPWEGPGDEAESRRLSSLAHFDGGSMKTYAEMVTRMDQQVGRVLDELARAGIASNTIVVFTSDNGGERFSDTWPFMGRKSELLEGGLRVPAIVRWPARLRPNRVTEQVAISMDWMPTLLAAAGTAPDPAYPSDGLNLLPGLASDAPPVSRKLYWRYRFRAQRAVRQGNMKWLEIDGSRFLFDLSADPLERANLKDRQPELFRRLTSDYAEWNSTMLPEDPASTSHALYADELADHYGNKKK